MGVSIVSCRLEIAAAYVNGFSDEPGLTGLPATKSYWPASAL
jgi:hypothetical protein